MNAYRYLATTVLVSALVVPAVAGATTIDYKSVGVFTGRSFSTGGLTATAENGSTLGINEHGLGVIGGPVIEPFGTIVIDTNESVFFSFDSGGASDVAFGSAAALLGGINSQMFLEGFGVGGASLGVKTFAILDAASPGTPIDVSAAFDDVVLTAFRIVGNGLPVGITPWHVTFTNAPHPPVVPAPEPATLVVCATGLVLAGWRRLRAHTRRGPVDDRRGLAG